MLKGRFEVTAQGMTLTMEGKDPMICERNRDESCDLKADGVGAVHLEAGTTGTVEVNLTPAVRSHVSPLRTSASVPAVPSTDPRR